MRGHSEEAAMPESSQIRRDSIMGCTIRGTSGLIELIRVTLQSDETTLTDAQADATIAAIVNDLRARFGATLRG